MKPWLGGITLWYLGIYIGLCNRRSYSLGLAGLLILASFVWLGIKLAGGESEAIPGLSSVALGSAGVGLLATAFMLLVGKPVFSALSFALAILGIGILLLLNQAAFLMAATILIYAGAIVVTFLFVIMLAQQRGETPYDFLPREPFLSCLAGWMLTVSLALVIVSFRHRPEPTLSPAPHALEQSSRSAESLEPLIRQAQLTLTKVIEALDTKQPRDEIVLILDEKTDSGIVFTSVMESLRHPMVWNEDKSILRVRRNIEKNYELLLNAIAGVPLDYGTARKEAVELLQQLGQYRELLLGARVLTNRTSAADTRGLGKALFGYYFLPVVFAGFLLLLATIGSFIAGKPAAQNLGE
ncbi:MAG: NADH-quinone oxidoreductase subunit J [Gemmatales bacterium]|nr:NADH-quinone oxidoreductase subunit J [Gemmatales bacterium]